MLFNSIDFAIFLPLVFVIYWSIGASRVKVQNLFLLFASYYFYGSWDYKFLLLIILSTIVDYSVGNLIFRSDNNSLRKRYLWVSILFNLGVLGYFKYANFFIENFTQAFSFFGYQIQHTSLNLILPVGISFYTFQTMSYSIDIYREKLKPTKDIISFATFVSFFPQLVAGPIERASNLLPQFFIRRQFTYDNGIEGAKQILWGLFKKVVIADNCANSVNLIFANSDSYDGVTLALGAVLFSFQIYCDFSGYSDIAIGVARLLGFKLMKNFNFPYFSRDIAEFWRRWHISLSSWFKDYLYIPLGGGRTTFLKVIRNTFVVFVVSGFWHGANWTFVFWGFLNALLFIPLLISNRKDKWKGTVGNNHLLPSFREFISIMFTFIIVTFTWIYFRSENINQANEIVVRIFTDFTLVMPEVRPWYTLIYLCFFTAIEWWGRNGEYALEKLEFKKRQGIYSLLVCYLLVFMIIFCGGEKQDFIYFQF